MGDWAAFSLALQHDELFYRECWKNLKEEQFGHTLSEELKVTGCLESLIFTESYFGDPTLANQSPVCPSTVLLHSSPLLIHGRLEALSATSLMFRVGLLSRNTFMPEHPMQRSPLLYSGSHGAVFFPGCYLDVCRIFS